MISPDRKADWSIAKIPGFGYSRENSGAFIIMEGERGTDEYNRVGTVGLTIRPKRGEAHRAEDPLALSRAQRLVRAVNSHAALVEAVEIFLGQDECFQVAVGGNPIAVDKMLERVRAALLLANPKPSGAET